MSERLVRGVTPMTGSGRTTPDESAAPFSILPPVAPEKESTRPKVADAQWQSATRSC